MRKASRMTVAAAAIGIAALSLATPAQAGNRSNIGAGLVGFGIGAVLGSMMGPPEVYYVPPPPEYYGPVDYGPPYYNGPYDGPYYDGPPAYEPMPRAPRAYGPRPYSHAKSTAAPPAAHRQVARPAPARVKTAKTTPSAPTLSQINDAKFKAALSKAKREGVHTLTQKDIEGLSVAQLKRIRGY